MENPFAITVPSESLLVRNGRGETTVTVTNTTARAFKGRAEILPNKAETAPWLTVVRDPERTFAPGSVEQFVVQLKIPAEAKAGEYNFRLRLADVSDPNERVGMGPVVGFTITAGTPPVVTKTNRWWIFVVIGVVLLLAIGGIVYWLVSREAPAPEPTPEPAPPVSTQPPATPPTPETIRALSGIWSGDDLGTYAVRVIQDEVWWFGQSNDSGRSWTNIFHGRINGQQIVGSWSDVPIGTYLSSGVMTLAVSDPSNFKAATKTGGFGGNSWVRLPGQGRVVNVRPVPEWPRGSGADQVTGVWAGDDGGTYAIRQVGPEIWWYGQSADNGHTFSNVFHGRLSGRSIEGNWADVPIGLTNSAGQITLEWTDGFTLIARGKTGGFGGNKWIRR